jgi:hypothetical protein
MSAKAGRPAIPRQGLSDKEKDRLNHDRKRKAELRAAAAGYTSVAAHQKHQTEKAAKLDAARQKKHDAARAAGLAEQAEAEAAQKARTKRVDDYTIRPGADGKPVRRWFPLPSAPAPERHSNILNPYMTDEQIFPPGYFGGVPSATPADTASHVPVGGARQEVSMRGSDGVVRFNDGINQTASPENAEAYHRAMMDPFGAVDIYSPGGFARACAIRNSRYK